MTSAVEHTSGRGSTAAARRATRARARRGAAGSLGRYVAGRLLQAALVLLAVGTIVFLISAVVGDPVAIREPSLSPDANYRARLALGLTQPLPEQYWHFLTGIVHGDLGVSLWQREPVVELVFDRLPATLLLAAATLVITIVVGVSTGIVAALRPGSWLDRGLNAFALAGVSLVNFWVGLLLIIVFSIRLGWLPTGGYGTFAAVILPAITLALRPLGQLSQFTKTAVAHELDSQYIMMARGRGLSEWRVIGYALRNAGIPLLTVLGDDFVELIAGVAVVETVFAWPGLGNLMVQAITQRDMILVRGAVLVVAAMVVVINLVIDLLYTVIDPKIELK